MPAIPALIVAGGAIAASAISSNASKKAAAAQAAGAEEASNAAERTSDKQIALQREQFNKQYALQQPIYEDGETARNRLMQLLGLAAGGEGNGSAMRDFSMADFQSDPGYQFRLAEGQKGIERSAAAQGNLLSGGALKDAARFTQGLASQDYQAAFDRFQVNRANKLNPLQSMSGAGQTAAGTLGAASQNFANGASNSLSQLGTNLQNNITGAANARASGYVGSANAVGNGLSTLANAYQQNRLMQQMNSGTSSLGGNYGSYSDLHSTPSSSSVIW